MATKISANRVKRQLVRAWFDTVLNPLIRALRSETDLLKQGHFTWRFHSQSFASLVPVRSHIMSEAWDNLDQFLSVYPQVEPAVVKHDDQLQELSRRVSEFYVTLIGHSAFLTALASSGTQGVGAGPDSIEHYAAENIVNNMSHLPNYYSTAQFWNANGTEFLKLRHLAGIREYWESVETARAGFASAVGQLHDALATLRNDLSFDKGVPIVASVAS